MNIYNVLQNKTFGLDSEHRQLYSTKVFSLILQYKIMRIPNEYKAKHKPYHVVDSERSNPYV